MAKNIFIASGEESGDNHGSALIKALKGLIPGVNIAGMGGNKMIAAGMTGLNSKELSVVGVVEIIGRLPALYKAYSELKSRLANGKFDAVVLIDFPDFNLRLAKEARKLGIPVIYYISPQVWAWRKSRLKTIATLVDRMLVVFPFEEKIYKDAGVPVEYVGHPLAESAGCALTKDEARKKLGLTGNDTVVALLPGSRVGEVKRLLKGMLTAGRLIEDGLGKKVAFLLPAAAGIDDTLLNGFLDGGRIDVKVLRAQMYEALRASDAAIVASGTATLETALIGTPMVIIYRMSALSFGVAKALVSVPFAGLPNIVAGRRICPELIQDKATAANIAEECLAILRDKERRETMIKELRAVKKALGSGGAALNAARAIQKIIG